MSLASKIAEVRTAEEAGFVKKKSKKKSAVKMAAAHGAKVVAVRAIADAVGGQTIVGKLLATLARHSITKGMK